MKTKLEQIEDEIGEWRYGQHWKTVPLVADKVHLVSTRILGLIESPVTPASAPSEEIGMRAIALRAIDAIRAFNQRRPDADFASWVGALLQLLSIADQLEAALRSPGEAWISVKERPKETGMYWTIRHTGRPSITEYASEGDFCGWGDDILYWMPILPTPPKEAKT